MFQRSFVFVLIAAAAVAVSAQTPAPEVKAEPLMRSFAFTMDGDGGYLGVQTLDVNKENFAKFGLREVRGVAVEKVSENSPAAAAGLLTGDVIVRFENEEITSVRKLTRLVSEVAPDHQVKITVLRGGSEQVITATLGKRPTPQFGNGNFKFGVPGQMGQMGPLGQIDPGKLKGLEQLKDLPNGELPKVLMAPGADGKMFQWRMGSGRQIGVGITPLTKQLAAYFGVDSGVMISEVRNGSPAFKAGLKAGDIITEVDGKAVKGEFDLIKGIGEKKDGDVNLTVVRDGKRQNISVTPEAAKDNGFVFQTGDEENG